jgi:hypothetical protein
VDLRRAPDRCGRRGGGCRDRPYGGGDYRFAFIAFGVLALVASALVLRIVRRPAVPGLEPAG